MVEINYGYHICSNCGHEGFQWGANIDDRTFICEFCLKNIIAKVDDKKKEAENAPHFHKTFNTEHDTVPLSDEK